MKHVKSVFLAMVLIL
ncbi:hypothetical protein F0D29_18390, partial [Salmonella enterica subsp. enterica]